MPGCRLNISAKDSVKQRLLARGNAHTELPCVIGASGICQEVLREVVGSQWSVGHRQVRGQGNGVRSGHNQVRSGRGRSTNDVQRVLDKMLRWWSGVEEGGRGIINEECR